MSNKSYSKVDKTIILTGGMGGFGRFITFELLKQHDLKLILLVLANSLEEARINVKKVLGTYNDRIEVFCSDLTMERLGLSESEYADLLGRTTHILHAAASIRFTLSLEGARRYNVKTTEQMINFAKKCSNLVRFGFVSSVMVAGKRSGLIMEDEFEHKYGFKNSYEQTKYEAEALVRASTKELSIAIFRPPLIITTVLPKSKGPINLITLAILLMEKGYLPFIPGSQNSTLDIMNSVDAARIITELLLKESLSHVTYHITNGAKAPTIGDIHTMTEQKFKKTIPLEFCGDMESFLQRVRKIPWYKFKLRMAYKRSASFLPEAAYPKVFDNHNTLSELNISQIGEDPTNTLLLVFNNIFINKLWNLLE